MFGNAHTLIILSVVINASFFPREFSLGSVICLRLYYIPGMIEMSSQVFMLFFKRLGHARIASRQGTKRTGNDALCALYDTELNVYLV